MNWITDLLFKDSVAHSILIYSIVIAVGIALGKIKVARISLGITFVLFAGIAVGHFGFKVNHEVLDFAKDFGLILFVFSIGLQVGPGFFSSFKKGGITLNMLAMSVVVLGVLTVIGLHLITGETIATLTGIMSGAVTNTPGLGAAQQALKQVAAQNPGYEAPNIGLGYAVAYPFGVLGIIITMILIRKSLRIDIQQELKLFDEKLNPQEAVPEKVSIVVTNPDVFGRKINELKNDFEGGVVVSRIYHRGNFIAPDSTSTFVEGDIVHLVAQKGDIPKLITLIGHQSELDLSAQPGNLMSRQVIITNRQVLGKTLGSLKLRAQFRINLTRINRAGVELVASPDIILQMGDKITVVGDEESIEKTAKVLGNSLKRLYEPNLIPIFIGIFMGVLLGSVPFIIPGIPTPIKLGLAGGPLVVAILLSKYGYRFNMISYTTLSANLMLREIGIVLFLASVGIKAGEKFIPTLASGDGFIWMGYGAIITILPIMIVGFVSRIFFKRNFFEICGLISGSMTDPPALAFANSIAQNEAPAVAYATVYPLVMFLRIIFAQLLILLFS
jgi:putative transport protein